MLYHNRAFYIFGGYGDSNGYQDTIARLDTGTQTWSRAGTLKNGRKGHGAIFDGEKFIILGGIKSGDETVKTEVCDLSGTSMTCTEASKSLENYSYYPELYLVRENFGKDISQC